MIGYEWNGEMVDQGVAKMVIDSFVSLGIDETDVHKASPDIYKKQFKAPFLEVTDKYYKAESEGFLADNSVSDYLKEAEERLRKEEDRVDRYLHTQRLANSVLRNASTYRSAHMSSSCGSHSKHSSTLTGTKTTSTCTCLLPAFVRTSSLCTERSRCMRRTRVQRWWRILPTWRAWMPTPTHTSTCRLRCDPLKGEADFFTAMYKAYSDFVDKTKVTGNQPTHSLELLQMYADTLLRRSNKMVEDQDI